MHQPPQQPRPEAAPGLPGGRPMLTVPAARNRPTKRRRRSRGGTRAWRLTVVRTAARRRPAAIAARCAQAVLACCLATALSAAGFTLMPRAAAASQPGRHLHNTATAGRPAPSRHRRAVNPVAAPPPHGTPHANTARAALSAALARLLRHHTGRLAAAVTDLGTGATATYHARQAFPTASIVKAGILAALLLQRQHQHAAPGPGEQALAAAMIENSDNAAATALWTTIGGAAGLAAADQALRLRHTVPGPRGWWGLTTTTVTDQLRLLSALTSPRSPLTAAARHYELALMRAVAAGQNWGVTATASPRTRPAVKNGWMPDGPAGRWVINSIGVISHRHQRLLLAVLSSGQPSQQAGIRQVQAAATAAAAAITTTPPCPR
jgi:beta-lactamase class A